jgi:hypothetical protein
MIYYLNELSILSPCSESQEQARELMEQFTTVCRKAKKIGYDNLRYEMKLKGICLSENYYVEAWLRDQEVEREIRDSFRNITVQTPFYENDDETVLEQQKTFIYSYRGKEALGLGLAHLKETLVVSFMTHDEWNTTNIDLEQWLYENNSINPVQILLHTALSTHIDTIRKTFEFNPKHGINGRNAQPNQSIMYCSTKQEAEILLNTALIHPKRDRWFCNYDNENNRFVVFLPHEEENDKYHGFHYENTPNADPDRDLNNPQNGIPRHFQEKLKYRMTN